MLCDLLSRNNDELSTKLWKYFPKGFNKSKPISIMTQSWLCLTSNFYVNIVSDIRRINPNFLLNNYLQSIIDFSVKPIKQIINTIQAQFNSAHQIPH